MLKQIIVNATALDNSGGLTILNQFIEAISNDGYEYIVFVPNGFNLKSIKSNIRIIGKNEKALVRRFIWDVFGINNWLRKENIVPSATLSLQNTNIRLNYSVPNFIYYHQSIPFFKKRWNPFIKEERTLWFYQKIYPVFVKLFLKKETEVFVQSNFIKYGFSHFFKFPIEKIHIISPKIEIPASNNAIMPRMDKSRLNLFYPATPFIYKNHEVLFNALSLLNRTHQKNITLSLTCNKQDLKSMLHGSGDHVIINYMGKISFNEVLGMYLTADCLLFPSFIETLGLPLIEAASFGLPIIASDLPYSKEVLKGYEGVRYAVFNDEIQWKEEILRLFDLKVKRFPPLSIVKSNSWEELFRLMNYKIKQNVQE